MAEHTNYITPEGYQRLTGEMDELIRVERPRVVREVQDAAAQGDRSENAEYIYGKRRLREIDRRLRFLQSRLKDIEVIDPATQGGEVVRFGATVEVEDEDGNTRAWTIVGEDEVDADRGRVSWKSPLGRALLRRREGDAVHYQRPDGAKVELTITALRWEQRSP